QPFAMAANPGINVDSLTHDQVVAIFTGSITNWRDIGGPDQQIVLVNRPASSAARATFKKYALMMRNEAHGFALTEDSNEAVSQAIRTTPGAVGYLGVDYLQRSNDLRIIKFNGKEPTLTNIAVDVYPIWSYAHMYTKGVPSGLTAAF